MNQDVIDFLRPESPTHEKLKTFLCERINLSEDKMRGFYPRWRSNERRLQAFITLKDYKNILAQETNDAGRAPVPTDIVVPYSYATAHTACTYMLHTFLGREPIFQVSSNNSRMIQNAHNMEVKLQYDCYHNRYAKHFWQFCMDQFVYGFGAKAVSWTTKQEYRSERVGNATQGMFAQILSAGNLPNVTRNLKTVYEGNSITVVDPFSFFPDPRVPMTELSREGEFVFWRSEVARHKLQIGEARGNYAYTSNLGPLVGRELYEQGESNRDLLSGGSTDPARVGQERAKIDQFVQLHEGVCYIPPDMQLPESGDEPRLWFFTIANKRQIIQAIPYDYDHGLLPIAIAEPNKIGKLFGAPSDIDFSAPLQDVASWFVNSHIRNTQKAIHNTLVVDPAMVEMQDLKRGGEARVIRLKQAAYGQDVRMALNQLQITDVTRSHMTDMQLFLRLADMITGINDNLRSVQNSGGRKTATEVRTAGESGASRLAARAQLVSAMAMQDTAMMMSLNNMQFLSQEFSYHMLGDEALRAPITLQPDQLVGDFIYPLNDGTLPLDRVALLDVWQQIFQVIATNPNVGMAFNIPKLFLYMAKLGGAQNVEDFLLNPNAQDAQMAVLPDAQVDAQVQSGNLIPSSALPGGNGTVPDPGQRMAGGM